MFSSNHSYKFGHGILLQTIVVAKIYITIYIFAYRKGAQCKERIRKEYLN